jgi:hypothetical protein
VWGHQLEKLSSRAIGKEQMMAKDKVIPCLIHIPCTMPDGTEVDPEKLNSFYELLDRQFGGSTPLGIVPGRWIADDGETVAENMHRVEVSVKKSQIGIFEKTAKVIGKATKQKTVYIVINFQAETRFLFVDDDEDEDAKPNESVG